MSAATEPGAAAPSPADAPAVLPARPRGRWSVALLSVVIVASAGAAVLMAWAAGVGPFVAAAAPAPALGLAAPLVVVALGVTWVRAAFGRNGATALARRAGASRRWAERSTPTLPIFFAAVGIAAIGVVAGLVGAPRGVALGVALGFAGAIVAMLIAIAARIAVVVAARRLVHQLPTTRLDRLEAGGGSVELALVVPPDAPTIEVPFLAGRWAAVQVHLDDHGGRFSWPRCLRVRDDTATAELELAGFEVSGWRVRAGVTMWSGERKPRFVHALEGAAGTTLAKAGETSLGWTIWAVAPGDTLYVVGDATEVAHGLGAFRGGDRRAIGASSEARAVAILDDETGLRAALARELRYQPLVIAFALAWLAALAWVTARMA